MITNFHEVFSTTDITYKTGVNNFSCAAQAPAKPVVAKKKRSKRKNLPSNVLFLKNEVIFKKILFRYHPSFTNIEAQHQVLNVLGPKSFNVEHLVEQAFSYMGGYDFVDLAGFDFNDPEFSDSKTVSVNRERCVAELSSIGNKIGTLRIVIYNPFIQDVHFLYMPFAEWNSYALACHGKNAGDKRLLITYSLTDMHYNQFTKFLVDDFVTLATRMDSVSSVNNPLPIQGSLF